MDKRDRFLGAMFGLAYGDAIGFPALFHRFQDEAIPRRRHQFLWHMNGELDEMRISRLMMPFTHRIEATRLEICPTDDTEWAILTLKALLNSDSDPTAKTFAKIWLDEVVPISDTVRSSFSERSAIENFKQGLLPPDTGNDNPLHYEDSAVARAVPIGLFCSGNPEKAAQLAEWDAQITQAEDGIYASRAMAVAIALLADGVPLEQAITQGRCEFPKDSWIAHVDAIARQCLKEITQPEDLTVLLTSRVINTVYSYGSAAPETLPAAFVIATACNGDLVRSCWLANTIAKSADSVPPIVGAICGALQGVNVISPIWREALAKTRGLCLPFLNGVDLEALILELLAKTDR